MVEGDNTEGSCTSMVEWGDTDLYGSGRVVAEGGGVP